MQKSIFEEKPYACNLCQARYKSDDSLKQHKRKEHGTDLLFKDFYDYFLEYYFPRIEKWAFVFRDVNYLTTNTHLEAFHRTFKETYLKKRSNVRVDFNLEMLFQFIENKKRKV